MLKEMMPEYVSGEEICKNLNVTRTAVWKHIQVLREDGYEIEARPRAGYALTGIPDRLFPEEIGDGLTTEFIGRKIYYYDRVVSTNDRAKELARAGAVEGTLVLAEEQTGGKGRLGRSWYAPPYKGICFSLILYPRVSPYGVAQVTMMTAVALATAIRRETGVAAGIKWPNDLLAGGRKICGILTELSAEMDRVNYLVVGAGINANQETGDFPGEVRDTATSLKEAAGRDIFRNGLVRVSLAEFERWYRVWSVQGFKPVLEAWKELSVSLNCPVRIHTLKNSWDGWAEDVDEDGALLVRAPGGGLQRLVSGEISLRLA